MTTTRIDASSSKLSEDSFNQTKMNFFAAIEIIDKEFGAGYAKANPTLIAAFLQSTSIEFQGVFIAAKIQELSDAIDNVAESIPNN